MNALGVRFEVFDPEDVAAFGGLSPNAALKRACDAAYHQGYRDGEAAAGRVRADDDAAILARIAEVADDLCVTNAEARVAILKSLRPLILQLTGAVLPACAEAGLATEINEVVSELAAATAEASLRVFVGAEHQASVQAALQSAGVAAKVVSDPDLSGLQARVSANEGWEQLDFGDAAQTAHRIVEDFFDAAKEGLRDAG